MFLKDAQQLLVGVFARDGLLAVVEPQDQIHVLGHLLAYLAALFGGGFGSAPAKGRRTVLVFIAGAQILGKSLIAVAMVAQHLR